MFNYQTINWWAWFPRPSTVWNDIIEGVFAVSFTLRFQNAQILKILASRSWLNELCTANRKIIWSFKISFQVNREIGPVLDVKAPNPKKDNGNDAIYLKKTNRKQKNMPTTNPCLPKDISFEWISVTAPSNKASLPVKHNHHKKFSPTSSHFATRRLQLETWMWLTKRMHQKAWCVLEARSHIPQTLHHQQRVKKTRIGTFR